MKVVIIGSAHPLRGGLAAYNERLAKAFQDAGDEVMIYSFSLQYPAFLFPGKSQFTDEPVPKNLKIKTCIRIRMKKASPGTIPVEGTPLPLRP